MGEFLKLICSGAFVSVIPLEIEANFLGIWWYRNSSLEMVISLLVGIGLAWACLSGEQENV